MGLCPMNGTRLYGDSRSQAWGQTESSSGEGPQPSKGEGLCQTPAQQQYPRRHPIGVDSAVDHSAQASENRHLAPSVEQEIYLKDTPVGAR